MRYQERIYIQNDNSAVRNRDLLNVNMSSDMCVFESPLFNVSGATKIDCTGNTGTTGVYIIGTATTIPFEFQFTANTDTFTATNATFRYEVYEYFPDGQIFTVPPVYQSSFIDYSGFSGTNTTIQNIPIEDLVLDGDYLIKGYYYFDACTDFLNRIGKKVDTLTYRSGTEFGLYDSDLDYYFVAISEADVPKLVVNSSNTPVSNRLFQQVIIPEVGTTNVVITNGFFGQFVVTLNGLVLANGYDYTYTGNVVTLSAATSYEDIITIIYTTEGGNNFVADNIDVTSAIVSGATNGEGSNNPYFNTTTGKYEVYTTVAPIEGGTILMMLNGATLANNIDYYQSTSNPKRIILEGDLSIEDLITLVYYPNTNVVNGLTINNPFITWSIDNPPQAINGEFVLEVSTGSTFSNFYSTGVTEYVVGQTLYYKTFVASGTVGTQLYYRVKNHKSYETLCGQIVESIAYSETIPIIIQSNAINSY